MRPDGTFCSSRPASVALDRGPHAAGGVRAQSFPVAIVATKHAQQRHAPLMKWGETEWRAVVASVHHHAHTLGGEPLEKIGDRWNAIVRVGHHADSHGEVRQCGGTSLRTRSS